MLAALALSLAAVCCSCAELPAQTSVTSAPPAVTVSPDKTDESTSLEGSTLAEESTHIEESPFTEETSLPSDTAEPPETAKAVERLSEPVQIGSFTTDIAADKAQALLADLSERLEGIDAAICFEDLESGAGFYSNAKTRYYYQSVTKAFYSSWLFQTLTDEELSSTLALTSEAKQPGGDVYYLPVGTELTVSYLIEQAVTNSDVTAYNLLFDEFGIEGFNRFAADNGSALSLKWGRFSGGNVLDAAALLRDIYEHRNGETAELIGLMSRTTFNELIPAGAPELTVAHKYGYGGDGLGFNDAAIVFAERPFMLVILSNLPATAEDFAAPFIEITETACEISRLME